MNFTGLLSIQREHDSKIQGVIVGVVTNNQDPDDLCRVKVKFPGICDDDESNWARVVTFMGGPERGALFLPEVEDEVLVAFEGGDINKPYVIGSLWNGMDKPPENNSSGENNLRMIKSRSGHIIQLDDSDGAEKIHIIDSSGENSITIDTENNKITIESAQDMDLLAKDGKLTIDAGEVEITSGGDATLKAAGKIELKADSEANMKGSVINLN